MDVPNVLKRLSSVTSGWYIAVQDQPEDEDHMYHVSYNLALNWCCNSHWTTCIRGCRKNNQGRLLAGNNFPPAKRNYGGRVWRVAIEGHYFPSSDATFSRGPQLDPTNMETGRMGYIHETDSENFVNPVTGANTQRIEAQWGAMKQRIVKAGNHAADAARPSF
ncbi:unnamed protein product [Darwinula stevensoni]|uniref:Uncharacterized protein n=1 Tax=Darwinula stevensoni TaxID=69355 RepID=A0A7R8X7Z1_9CRUS|nr:unnamed protein product [Darwinula stevensoni]CAG0881045.1 unnamed protein product [Darwinula stevensoni]